MYGLDNDEVKSNFIVGLSFFSHCLDVSYVVGGEFSILRHVLEKNKPTVLSPSSELLNMDIHSLALREVYMKGGLIDKGSPTLQNKTGEFKFDLSSLKKSNFITLVKDIWEKTNKSEDTIDILISN
jgi:hypothetical protein